MQLSWYPSENAVKVEITDHASYVAMLLGKHTGLVHPMIEREPEGVILYVSTEFEDEEKRRAWAIANLEAIRQRVRFEMLRPLTWN